MHSITNSSFIMPIGTLVGINKPTTERIKMKARKPKAHGHKGNAKSWQVHYRDNAVERAEMKEFGCTGVDRWEVSPNLRLTQADRMIDRLEAMKCEYKLINLNLTTERGRL